MAAGFSVKDALNKNSKAGIDESPRARFRTKDISIFKMYRNDMNFYSVEQIEELAGDILMYGLKQNLELVYAPCDKGEYRIVAGERRWEALKYLVSKGYKEFELATSKLTTPQDNDEEQVEIIIANAYRTKTTSDMIEEETRLKASLDIYCFHLFPPILQSVFDDIYNLHQIRVSLFITHVPHRLS